MSESVSPNLELTALFDYTATHAEVRPNNIMASQKVNPLEGENLLTLHEAAEDFGGVSIPYNTVKLYAYQGVKGTKLDSVKG